MSDKLNKQQKKKSDMELLETLLGRPGTAKTPADRHATSKTSAHTPRKTGAIPSTRATSGISVKRNTGAISTPQNPRTTAANTLNAAPHTQTGSMRTSLRETGSFSAPRATGSITTTRSSGNTSTMRNTGALNRQSERTALPQTGTGSLRRTTGTSQTKRIAPPRYTIEEDDYYGLLNQNSSVIYTAGTNLFWIILIAIIVWLVVSMAQANPNQSFVSEYTPNTSLRAVAQIIGIQLPEPTAAPAAKPIIIPPGESSILGTPTISAEQIDAILRTHNSPAQGTGQIWIEAGLQYGIDPIYALAFFMHESGYGTNPEWAGLKPDGTTTHNVGNIICAGYRTCFGRFRDYADWRTGIYDWYRLIAVEYVQWRGLATVEGILPVYAPAFENDVPRYVNAIKYVVAEWRQTNALSQP